MFNRFVAGHPLVKFHIIDSTNNYAANLIRDNKLAEGTVIMADYQTDGKGQRGNDWVAEAGKNLLFSLIYYPEFLPVKEQYLISLITSLAAYHVINDIINADKTNKNVKIKWPNDILVDGKKIAGILIENSSSSNLMDSTIIGVGLNVNQFDFGMIQATSLYNETYQKTEIIEVLASFLENLDRYYHILKTQNNSTIREEYLSKMYLLNHPAPFLYRGKKIFAQVLGISEYGMLEMIDLDRMEVFLCDIKEIVYL